MPEYYSYHGPIRDQTEKHVIERGRIDTYQKSGPLLASLRKWNFAWSFKIDRTTKTLDERVQDNGCGWVQLDNGDKKYIFFVYKYARDFIRELKSRGFP